MNPYILVFCATFLYGTLAVLTKKAGLTMQPFTFIGLSMSVLAAASLLCALFFEQESFAGMSKQSLYLVVIFGLVNFAGFVLYVHAIRDIPVAHYALLSAALTPLFAAGVAMLVLHEAFTLRIALAVPIVLLGLGVALYK